MKLFYFLYEEQKPGRVFVHDTYIQIIDLYIYAKIYADMQDIQDIYAHLYIRYMYTQIYIFYLYVCMCVSIIAS